MRGLGSLAALAAVALTGCSVLQGNPVPPPPPVAPEVALYTGGHAVDLQQLLVRGPKGKVTGFKPLHEARDAVAKADKATDTSSHARASLHKAHAALTKAQSAWQSIAGNPLGNRRALGSVMHDSHMARRWGQITLARTQRDVGLHGVLQAQKQIKTRQQADAKWLGKTLVPGQAGSIHFQSGTTRLTPASQKTLASLAAFLHKHPRYGLTVAGYSDNTPPSSAHLRAFVKNHPDKVDNNASRAHKNAAYNRWKSLQRARAVVQALAARGIKATRLTAKGHGQSHPVASNATAAGRRQNRRVKATVVSLAGH